MQKSLPQKVHESIKENLRHKRWRCIVTAMACVVVFCTTYALILPAITMTGETYCGKEPHTHTQEKCYERILICGLEETEDTESTSGHTHTDACYETRSVLVCKETESTGHTHDESCYDEAGNLTCGQTETTGHSHGNGCYQEECVLTCGQEETEDTEPTSGHIHTDDCYEEELVCQLEEHEHSLACFSNPEADVESASVWERTLPTSLGDNWAENVVAVAKSQIGYTESTANYAVDENNAIHGYTRYGAWFGNPYGDWCAMFASFCLHYAGVPQTSVPYASGCIYWVEQLQDAGLYESAADCFPEPGFLVFFDTDGDELADHVGIVTEVAEDGESIQTVEGNIGGAVVTRSYPASKSTILGYGVLPESPALQKVAALIDALPSPSEVEAKLAELLAAEDNESYNAYCAELTRQVKQANAAYEALTDEQKDQLNIDKLTALFIYLSAEEKSFTLTAPATKSGIIVTISGEVDSLPVPVEELTLIAAEVEDDNAIALQDGALERENLTTAKSYILDIRLMHSNIEVQPSDPITVEFAGLPLEEDADAAFLDDAVDGDNAAIAHHVLETPMSAMTVNETDAAEIDGSSDETGASDIPGIKVYQIDANTQQVTEVDAMVDEENNVVLEIGELTDLYSVSLLAENGNVTTADTLKTACEAGGTVVLGKDISISDTITIDGETETTLDLNGYKITFTNTAKNAELFHVAGGSLTIMDGTANADGISKNESRTKRSSIVYAEGARQSLASISKNKLTYYVVESIETNADEHLTTETQWTRTVTLGSGQAGAIVGKEKDGQVAIYQAGGTVTMTGGYICGFGSVSRPGKVTSAYNDYNSAITIVGGQFNLAGGVLAANRSYAHGGAIYMYGKNCSLDMTGGIISGNYVDWLGGGIYCSSDSKTSGSPSITISGNSYITSNTANGYYDGKQAVSGGGIYCRYRTALTMNGGYITGNYAKGSGGGIEGTINEGESPDYGARIYIYGGYVSSNKCLKMQGGGVTCNYSSQCTIQSKNGSKIYLTNNQMLAENMFGGGAIYIGHQSVLTTYNTLVSENTAKHIGGGFSSCFVSNSFVFLDHGVAIFDNHDGGADGKPRSGDGAHDITNYNYTGPSGNPNPYPISEAADGHQDVYMGGNTRIYAGMLGGGDPNWSGSCDGTRITVTKADQYCTAGTVIGLTAHPSDDDKNTARSAADVYITGNYSARYGGGIMSNGTVYFGYRPIEQTLPTRITLVGTKSLLQKDGETAAAIADGRFTVTVTNTKNASEVYTGTVDSSGNINFPVMLFQSQGTTTYKIKEAVNSAENITYDTTTYTMTVTLAARQKIGTSMGGLSEEYSFPTTVKIVNDTTGKTVFSSTNVHNNSIVILRSTASGGAAFTNQLKNEEYALDITKQDAVTGKGIGVATFEMQTYVMDPRPVGENNKGTGQEMYIGMYCVQVKEGVYRYVGYSWKSGMPANAVRTFDTDAHGNLQILDLPAGKYQIREKTAPTGYLIADQWKKWNDVPLDAAEAPDGIYTIAVADPPATYTFQFLKVSAVDKTMPVPGAKYKLLDNEGKDVKFVEKETIGYQYNDSGTVFELVTNENGEFQLIGLPYGNYTLIEVEAPAGFGIAEDYTFTLSPETAADQIFTYTQEEPVVYELPQTGGVGVQPYIIGGALLLAGSLLSGYVLRRKRERRSME